MIVLPVDLTRVELSSQIKLFLIYVDVPKFLKTSKFLKNTWAILLIKIICILPAFEKNEPARIGNTFLLFLIFCLSFFFGLTLFCLITVGFAKLFFLMEDNLLDKLR